MAGAGVSLGLNDSFLYPSDRADADAALTTAQAALGEDAFARAWSEGQAMTLDEAVEYVMEHQAA